MKLRLLKEVKSVAIITLALIAVTLTLYLIYTINTPTIKSKEQVLFDSKSNATLDYKVQLMPNPIYSKRTLGPSQSYISTFTDTVDITYDYGFQGSEASKIDGSYTITLALEAYTIKNKEHKNLWTKKYPKIATKDFHIDEETYSAHETFSIPLNQFLTFVNQLDQNFSISSDRRLVISCITKMASTSPHGTITNEHKNQLFIPLTKNFYEIDGNLEDMANVPITTLQRIIIPPSRQKITLLAILLFLTVLALVYSIFFIIPMKADPKERFIKTLFKKYSSRFVSLKIEMDLLMVDKPVIYVRTFDGLVRMSDELVQPIMYTYRESQVDINRFYVIHQDAIYCYDHDHETLSTHEQENLLNMMDKRSDDVTTP